MQHIYCYLIIFGAGVLCSLLTTYFAIKFVPNERKNYLSEEHYLQVRDDYSLTTNNLIEDHLDQSERTNKLQRKNRDEGEICVAKIALFRINLNRLFISDENEALSTLKVAIELKAHGKTEKALRLFKHALALAPKHPEILTKYGEFLEHNQSDIITADLMYFQVSLRVAIIIL